MLCVRCGGRFFESQDARTRSRGGKGRSGTTAILLGPAKKVPGILTHARARACVRGCLIDCASEEAATPRKTSRRRRERLRDYACRDFSFSSSFSFSVLRSVLRDEQITGLITFHEALLASPTWPTAAFPSPARLLLCHFAVGEMRDSMAERDVDGTCQDCRSPFFFAQWQCLQLAISSANGCRWQSLGRIVISANGDSFFEQMAIPSANNTLFFEQIVFFSLRKKKRIASLSK